VSASLVGSNLVARSGRPPQGFVKMTPLSLKPSQKYDLLIIRSTGGFLGAAAGVTLSTMSVTNSNDNDEQNANECQMLAEKCDAHPPPPGTRSAERLDVLVRAAETAFSRHLLCVLHRIATVAMRRGRPANPTSVRLVVRREVKVTQFAGGVHQLE